MSAPGTEPPVGEAAAARIRIYGRAGCHLCEVEEASIRALAGAHGIAGRSIEVVDIERDERLFAAMLERIPVVELDGERVGELDEAAAGLESALRRRAAATGPRSGPRRRADTLRP